MLFRSRGFRLLWTATLLSSTARWADLVVVGWLTLELTESPLMVGIVAGSKMAGYILAPFMGVAADRVDRRLLLIIAALVNWAVSAIMLLLFVTSWLTLTHIIILSLVSSMTWALDNPTRQAFVPDLVGREDLTSAIALNAELRENFLKSSTLAGHGQFVLCGINLNEHLTGGDIVAQVSAHHLH